MARVKKSQMTFDSLFFSAPEQKIMRFLLSTPTTSYPLRVMSSKLKGVRGLGGVEGLTQVLLDLKELGLVDFVDNQRAVRLQDEHPYVQILKKFSALCDLEGLKTLLEPISSKGILYGSHAHGKACTDSDYELFVVTDSADEAKNITTHHPLGKRISLSTRSSDDYQELEKKDSQLAQKLAHGIVLWGRSW